MQRASHSARRTWALILVLSHLLVVAMAGSSWLHHRLHGDADAPDHSCAVTAVLAGQIDQPDLPDVALAPGHFIAAPAPILAAARPPIEAPRNCAQERAPPAA
jgi:hypothetical protein